jgi:glycine cleavage system H protein
MSVPAELRYTAEHEWVAIEGETATIGITDFAAQALGDVVFVSLPTVGATVSAGDPCGEVESYKSVSELYSPVTGEVNAEPYHLGWIFRVRLTAGTEATAGLLSGAEYEELTASAG